MLYNIGLYKKYISSSLGGDTMNYHEHRKKCWGDFAPNSKKGPWLLCKQKTKPQKKIIIIFLRVFFFPVYEDKCLKKLLINKSIKVESLNLPFFSIIVSFFFQTKVSYVCRLKVIYGTQFTCFTRSHRTSTTKMAGLKLHLST